MNEAIPNTALPTITQQTDFITVYLPKLNAWDIKICRQIYHKYTDSRMRKAAKITSFFADPRLWAPMIILFATIGFIIKDFSLVTIFLTGFLQSFVFYFIVKKIAHRNRPFVQLDDIIRLDKTGHGYSFPSGHCHHSTILMGLIWLSLIPSPWFVIVLLIYNFLIAYSRIISGCHFPSDTIIGILQAYLALLFYWLFTKALYLRILEWGMGLFF